MKIGIIGAMAQEIEILRQVMVEPKVTELAGCKILKAKLTIPVWHYYNRVSAKLLPPSALPY